MNIMIDFLVLIFIYLIIFYRKWKVKGKVVLLVNTVMYVYLAFLLYFTLMPVVTSLPFIWNHPYVPMNFIPFRDMLDGRGDFVRQIVLKIPVIGRHRFNYKHYRWNCGICMLYNI